MQSVEDTAQSMFQHKQRSINSMLMTFREIKGVIDMFKNRNIDETPNLTQEYHFTGQHTDIAFVDANGTLDTNTINQIKDDNLRQNVMQSYSDAVNDGYLTYDNGNFRLTEKGREHINSEPFKEQFEKDQLYAMSKNKAQITLNGNASDLNVFRYTDQINLNHLAYSDPAKFKRVISYFEKCQKYDFVKISSDGTVVPTEKCYQYLEQNKKFSFNINKINPDNIQKVTKDISKITQEATKKATQETAKKVAQETAKKAVETATKTAVASSGVATAGVSTAVTAVVDLSSKGIKALSQNTNLQQTTPTLQNRT